MSYLQKALKRLEPYIERMKETHHDNEWHLEGDVWTHTQMVIDNTTLEISELLALFHDVGKIDAKAINERTGRVFFPLHWFISGNYFRWLMRDSFDTYILFSLTRLIQLHHYYQFHKTIREKVFTTELFNEEKEILLDLLLADLKGRIVSKDKREIWLNNIKETERIKEWAYKYEKEGEVLASNLNRLKESVLEKVENGKVFIVPIGIPKSGKTTTAKKLQEALEDEGVTMRRIGFDDIRVQIGSNGKKQSIEEVEDTREYIDYYNKTKNVDLLSTLRNIIKRDSSDVVWIDNMNITIKSRRLLINALGKRNQYLAVFFDVTFEEVMKRKRNYEISFEPAEVLKRLFFRVELPFNAEKFSEIHLLKQ